MDVRDLSDGSAASADDLKLKNRLNESRSPYVSASAISSMSYMARLMMITIGSRTHEQSGRMANVGS